MTEAEWIDQALLTERACICLPGPFGPDASFEYACDGCKQRALAAEVARLRAWVGDLQSGMWINCVYCGHRYGPRHEATSMQAALTSHIEQCPRHPASALKAEVARLRKLALELVQDNLGHQLDAISEGRGGDEDRPPAVAAHDALAHDPGGPMKLLDMPMPRVHRPVTAERLERAIDYLLTRQEAGQLGPTHRAFYALYRRLLEGAAARWSPFFPDLAALPSSKDRPVPTADATALHLARTVLAGQHDALPVLADRLEELGDVRAASVRELRAEPFGWAVAVRRRIGNGNVASCTSLYEVTGGSEEEAKSRRDRFIDVLPPEVRRTGTISPTGRIRRRKYRASAPWNAQPFVSHELAAESLERRLCAVLPEAADLGAAWRIDTPWDKATDGPARPWARVLQRTYDVAGIGPVNVPPPDPDVPPYGTPLVVPGQFQLAVEFKELALTPLFAQLFGLPPQATSLPPDSANYSSTEAARQAFERLHLGHWPGA